MFSKLKQFKDLKSQANALKSELAKETAEGKGAWGKVVIKMDGNQQVVEVTIDPELAKDVVKVQDGVKEATNDAIKKVQRIMAMKMQSGDFKLPGM